MRHRVQGKKLSRNSEQRQALFKGLLAALITEGEVTTSLTKAKVMSRLIDKLITRAKKPNLNSRRIISAFFNQKEVVNKLVDELAPVMQSRVSGYTRIIRIGNRQGDNSEMVKIQFIDKVIVATPVTSDASPKTKSKTSEKTKPVSTTSPIRRAAQKITAKSGNISAAVKPTVPRTTSK